MHDRDTAPEESVGDELRKSLESAAEFKGSDKEKQLRILCSWLEIDFDGLSDDEFTAMTKVLRKSKRLKSIVSQRGKTSF